MPVSIVDNNPTRHVSQNYRESLANILMPSNTFIVKRMCRQIYWLFHRWCKTSLEQVMLISFKSTGIYYLWCLLEIISTCSERSGDSKFYKQITLQLVSIGWEREILLQLGGPVATANSSPSVKVLQVLVLPSTRSHSHAKKTIQKKKGWVGWHWNLRYLHGQKEKSCCRTSHHLITISLISKGKAIKCNENKPGSLSPLLAHQSFLINHWCMISYGVLF